MQWISAIASCLLVKSSLEPELLLPKGAGSRWWVVPGRAFSHYMHYGSARAWRMKTTHRCSKAQRKGVLSSIACVTGGWDLELRLL